ncbi:hypothetical protein ACFLZV_01895 [Candidatus Margulisiibacteriota bacterium]
MKKLFFSLIFLFLFSPSVWAIGDYFMLPDLGTSARMIRIGNIEGFSKLANVTFENPSSLHRLNRFSASAFMTTLMHEVEYKNLALGIRLPIGVVGLGYMTAEVSEIPHTYMKSDLEETFGVDEYFNYHSSLAKVAYCLSQSKNIHFGISATYFLTNLYTYTGSGYNFDAGVTIENEKLAISIAMKNIASSLKVKYKNSEEENYSGIENLPLQTVFAIKYLIDDFAVYAQIKSFGSNRKLTNALGLSYTPSILPIITISGGYKEFVVIREVRNNYSLGIGLNLFDISFDYAYERSEHIQFNHKHYFSVGLEF